MSQTYTIELRRGLKANLPSSGTHVGEPFFCTDTNELFIWNGTAMVKISGVSAFSALSGGTNTSADMIIGSGAQLQPSGTGVINATEINGVPIPATNSGVAGKIPIAQGDGTAAWSDPFVQGVYAPGTRTDTGGISGGAINPVLIGGSDYSGTPELRNLKVDSSGNIYIGGTVAVTQSTSPWVVSGTVTANAGTGTFAVQDAADVAAGTTSAPSKVLVVAGVTNDSTPQYQPIPMSNGGAGVLVAIQKTSSVLTTTALGSNATYTSSSFDSTADGTILVEASLNYVGSGNMTNFTIQQADDPSVTVWSTVASTIPTSNSGGNSSYIYGMITARYYRITATNSSETMSSMKIVMTKTSDGASAIAGASSVQGVTAFSAMGASLGGDGLWAISYAEAGNNLVYGANCSALYKVAGTPNSTNWVSMRTPTTFKTASATASGNTALWTPASGKKFRLMRLFVQLTANATLATSGVLTITFQDGSTGIPHAFDCYVPSSTGSPPSSEPAGFNSGWIDLDNGILSSTANNVLNVNLSATLATGNVRVTCCGCEE